MSELRELLERARDEIRPEPNGFDRLVARRRRTQRRKRTATATLAIVIALGTLAYVIHAFSRAVAPRPAGGPDGNEIVFTRFRRLAPTAGEPTHAIFSIPVDGGEARALTPADALYLAPAWSPDGKTLAVVRYAATEDPPEGIYTIDVASGEQHHLLTTGLPIPISVWQLAWSPDGTQIGYINARYPDSGGPHSDAQTQLRLFVMNADGSDSQPVTPADVNVSSFAWSPDGSQIAYTVESSEPGGRATSDIWVMDLNGSQPWALTTDGFSNQPAWSPRGDEIAFVRHSEDYRSSDVYLVSSNGVAVWRLTDTPQRESEPAWSPDGSQLVFTRIGSDFESCRLVVASTETGAERELVSYDALGGCAQSPVWEPSATPPDGSSN